MLLFGIPDICLFWSLDQCFLEQFKEGEVSRFVPVSKFPPCYKDLAFWLPSSSSAAAGQIPFHENGMMNIVRNVAGDLAEDVKLVFNEKRFMKKLLFLHDLVLVGILT